VAGKRNLTIQLEDDVIRKAKVLAARRDTSVSALIARELTRLVAEDDAYQAAKQRAVERLGAGYHLGGPPYPSRDELHDRQRA